jgi:hypothetical protein
MTSSGCTSSSRDHVAAGLELTFAHPEQVLATDTRLRDQVSDRDASRHPEDFEAGQHNGPRVITGIGQLAICISGNGTG